MESKYIKFVPIKRREAAHFATPDKHKAWEVISKQDASLLGHVGWFVRWHRYCFYPDTGSIYDPICLRDVANFCDEQTTAQSIHKSTD